MTQAYNLAILANAVDTSGRLNVGTNATGTLPVANGGSGASTLAANNVLLGNGTSALQTVAPGTNGNVLTSNGTTWVSSAPSGGVTSLNGQTGAITDTNLDAIGSYVAAVVGITIPVVSGFTQSVNTTVAGSSLRYGFSTTARNGLASYYYRQINGSTSVGYAGGGSALSGTWRCLGIAHGTWQDVNCGADSGGTWWQGLFVRIS